GRSGPLVVLAGDFETIGGYPADRIGVFNTNQIQAPVVNGPLCPGFAFEFSFTASGDFLATNAFSIQLSDSVGDFSDPTVIATLPGTSGGTLDINLPSNIPGGDGYFIRVVASHPSQIGLTSN